MSYIFSYDEEFPENFYDINEFDHQIIKDPFSTPIFDSKLTSEDIDDDNYDRNYFQKDYTLNQNPVDQIGKLLFNDNKKTKPATLTNPLIEKKEESNEIKVPNLIDNKISIKPEKLLSKKRGRKNKEVSLTSNDQFAHTKKKEDNIMRKIKTHLMDFIVKLLNDSLINKTQLFYKIDKTISENLKRDLNMELMQKTLFDLFSNSKTNGRYKNYSNEILIKKIVEEKIEVETLRLLRKKFIEIKNEIQENYLEEYLGTIEKKESNMDNSSVDEYMETLRKIFLGYEDWFKNKKGRNRESKAEQE